MSLLLFPPVALIINLVAVFRDESKTYAIVGLVISGLMCFLFFLPAIASLLCW